MTLARKTSLGERQVRIYQKAMRRKANIGR